MDEKLQSSPNPMTRCGHPLRSLAVSRRYAFMRLGFVEHALAVDLRLPSEAPTYRLWGPVTVNATPGLLRVEAKEPNGTSLFFELYR